MGTHVESFYDNGVAVTFTSRDIATIKAKVDAFELLFGQAELSVGGVLRPVNDSEMIFATGSDVRVQKLGTKTITVAVEGERGREYVDIALNKSSNVSFTLRRRGELQCLDLELYTKLRDAGKLTAKEKVLAYLKVASPAPAAEIAEKMLVSRAAVNKALAELLEEKLVAKAMYRDRLAYSYNGDE